MTEHPMPNDYCFIGYDEGFRGGTPYCIQHPDVRGQDAVTRHLLDVLPKRVAVVEAQITLAEHADHADDTNQST